MPLVASIRAGLESEITPSVVRWLMAARVGDSAILQTMYQRGLRATFAR